MKTNAMAPLPLAAQELAARDSLQFRWSKERPTLVHMNVIFIAFVRPSSLYMQTIMSTIGGSGQFAEEECSRGLEFGAPLLMEAKMWETKRAQVEGVSYKAAELILADGQMVVERFNLRPSKEAPLSQQTPLPLCSLFASSTHTQLN